MMLLSIVKQALAKQSLFMLLTSRWSIPRSNNRAGPCKPLLSIPPDELAVTVQLLIVIVAWSLESPNELLPTTQLLTVNVPSFANPTAELLLIAQLLTVNVACSFQTPT